MKLLFDENLSRRLVSMVRAEFPGSTHPDLLGIRGVTDAELWERARRDGFTIVSKDSDLRQRVFLYGPPPKVIWVSVGNAGTDVVAGLLLAEAGRIEVFSAIADAGLLILSPRRSP
jgi:predicted nuclease of predicted toxin-antitoxin system